MNEYIYTYWITNGRRRIVKKIIIPAKYRRVANKQAEQIIKIATPSGYIAVNAIEIEDCRQAKQKMVCGTDRIPVLVYVYNKKVYQVCVQFWTPLMITVGRCGHDGGTDIFLDYLRYRDA